MSMFLYRVFQISYIILPDLDVAETGVSAFDDDVLSFMLSCLFRLESNCGDVFSDKLADGVLG